MNKKNTVERSVTAEERESERMLTILVILLGGLLAAHNLWHAAHPSDVSASVEPLPAANESHWIVQAADISWLQTPSEQSGWTVAGGKTVSNLTSPPAE